MKERGILFSAPMVRALLDGSKTQTRRTLKPQPEHVEGATWVYRAGAFHPCRDELCRGALDKIGPEIRCPYGVVGDRLWVRETFQIREPYIGRERGGERYVNYRADAENVMPWNPSIFMPRWASRITLELTDVRVQRLQDISREDCVAEGIRYEDAKNVETRTVVCPLIDQYAELWDSINGEGAWAANPWVWALTFKRVTP